MNAVRASLASLEAVPAVDGDIWRAKEVFGAVFSSSGVLAGIGIGNPTVTASVQPATGSTLASTGYGRRDTGAGADSSAVLALSAQPVHWLGDTALRGGFRIELYCAIVTVQTTMKNAWGLTSAVTPSVAAVEPSAFVSCMFLGSDSGDTNMQIMHNDSAGTCTKVDLGANFPKSSGAYYKLTLTTEPNAGTVDYTVDRIDSAFSASGTLSTNLPANTFFMYANMTLGNGSTAAVASIGCTKFLSEIPLAV
jgi:hypothetical protein